MDSKKNKKFNSIEGIDSIERFEGLNGILLVKPFDHRVASHCPAWTFASSNHAYCCIVIISGLSLELSIPIMMTVRLLLDKEDGLVMAGNMDWYSDRLSATLWESYTEPQTDEEIKS